VPRGVRRPEGRAHLGSLSPHPHVLVAGDGRCARSTRPRPTNDQTTPRSGHHRQGPGRPELSRTHWSAPCSTSSSPPGGPDAREHRRLRRDASAAGRAVMIGCQPARRTPACQGPRGAPAPTLPSAARRELTARELRLDRRIRADVPTARRITGRVGFDGMRAAARLARPRRGARHPALPRPTARVGRRSRSDRGHTSS